MLFTIWFLSGLFGGLAFLLSVNYAAGLPLLRLSDLGYLLFFTLLGPISATVAGFHFVFICVQNGVKWLINKFNNGNDTTLIP